jgi:hypothetical protein
MVMMVIISLMIVTIILGRNVKEEVRVRHYIILLMLVMLQVAAMVITLVTMGLPPPLPKF